MKREIKAYHKDNLVLRLLDKRDLVHTLQWRNHESHRHWFVSTDIISEHTHLAWFRRYQRADNDFIFLVSDSNGARYGQLSIYDVDWENKCAKFGRFLVNPDFAGLGIMKNACLAGLELASCILKLKKLTLEVKQNNHAAIHIYQSSGFSLCKSVKNDMVTMQIEL